MTGRRALWNEVWMPVGNGGPRFVLGHNRIITGMMECRWNTKKNKTIRDKKYEVKSNFVEL